MTRQNAIPMENNNNISSSNNNIINKAAENQTESKSSETEESMQIPVLIPFWDFANHFDGIVTTLYNVNDGQVEGATHTDIKKGEQIFIHYGNRNNANLLIHNG